MRIFIGSLLCALGAFAAGGCVSPKFQKAWKDAGTDSADGKSRERWVGRWESRKHGVGGRLRAVLVPPERSATGGSVPMSAYFEAKWHGFTTAYPVSLQAESEGKPGSQGGSPGVFRVFGKHDLKSFVGGGTYTYSGKLTPSKFEAEYESKYDQGVFSLTPSPAR